MACVVFKFKEGVSLETQAETLALLEDAEEVQSVEYMFPDTDSLRMKLVCFLETSGDVEEVIRVLLTREEIEFAECPAG